MKRTKIIATLGPATDDPQVLGDLIKAGVDVVRLNFSHGSAAEQIARAKAVRDYASTIDRQIGVMVDLQGPKIRVAKFLDTKINLVDGDKFCIDTEYDVTAGTNEIVGCSYATLSTDLNQGDTLMIDDGRIVLWVEDISGSKINCIVKVGGALSNNKGINVQGGGLSAPALTKKDMEDIKTAAEMKADYLAVSFVESADDIHNARRLINEAGWSKCSIVAKVERAEAVKDLILESIVEASDVVMVARGDLGVEIGDACLPPVQKQMIRMARSMNRVVITATQMMESMIENTIPTRAEVFDVANAVLDGTDAVMLSAETAAGKHPVKAVAAMAKVCEETEKQRTVTKSDHRLDSVFVEVDESIAMAAMYVANHLKVKAIACLTESGSTTLWMSRISSGIPVFAMTPNLVTRRKVTMYRGVYPVSFDLEISSHALLNEAMINELLRRGVVRDGDYVILTKGDLRGTEGGTNAMKIIRVGDHAVSAPDDEHFV